MTPNFQVFTLVFFCAAVQVQSFTLLPPNNSNNVSAAVAIGGDQRLYSVAGGNAQSRALASVDVYSITSNTHINNIPDAPFAVFGLGSMLNAADTSIYTVGGLNNQDQDVASFLSYPLGTTGAPWNTGLPNFPFPVSDVRLVGNLGDGMIYAFGGYSSVAGQIQSVFAYNPNTRTWTRLPTALPEYNRWSCAVVVRTSIFYFANGNMYRSDDAAQTWRRVSSASIAGRQDAACTAVDVNKILIAGGSAGASSAISDAELYYVDADSWKTLPVMVFPRTGARAALLNTGAAIANVLVCGGSDGGQTFFNTCEVYDLASNTWGVAGFTIGVVARAFFGLFTQSF